MVSGCKDGGGGSLCVCMCVCGGGGGVIGDAQNLFHTWKKVALP